MDPRYFPILKALRAEFTALEKLEADNANDIIPLFEFPKVPDKKKYRESSIPVTEFIDDTCEAIGRVWAGKYALFDAYQWSPTAATESGEHVIPYAYGALTGMGVKAVPVVGYDRWSVQEYQLALRTISRAHQGAVCIRLDHAAFEDSAEPGFFQETLEEILSVLELDPRSCHVILDFEDVTPLAVVDLVTRFEQLFGLIAPYRFMTYSVAGCSLPKTINLAVDRHNSCGTVLRKEMVLWQSVRERFPHLPIWFGDYGVRGPNTNEGVPSRHTNGKIRYTMDKGYFVARGHSISIPPKGGQMWQLADWVVESECYLGSKFSWGDGEILRCSKREFKGNAGQWIAIDTNHHLSYVLAEIAEFERALVNKAGTVSR